MFEISRDIEISNIDHDIVFKLLYMLYLKRKRIQIQIYILFKCVYIYTHT